MKRNHSIFRKCLGLCISLLVASGLSHKAVADGVWTYTDNETLYERMLSYLHETQQVFMGEPYYFMVQQFIVEVKAAHLNDRYAWLGQTHRFCNQIEAIYPPAVEHVSVMAEDRYERLRRSIVKLRDYPMHEMSITSADDDNVVPPADQVTAFHAANRQWLLQKRDAFLNYLTSEPRPKDGSVQVLKLYSSCYLQLTRRRRHRSRISSDGAEKHYRTRADTNSLRVCAGSFFMVQRRRSKAFLAMSSTGCSMYQSLSWSMDL